MTVIRAVDLQFRYDDGTPALNGVTLEVAAGDFVFLLGRNGSGKSTLLQHFNRLLRPASGQVYYRGCPLSALPAKDVFRSIGLVFQDPNDQLFGATVADDVAFGPRNLGLPAEEVRARVAEALRTAGLNGLEHRPVHNLSFGQKRRVAIAGVLAMRPDVLLLDEPTAGLDPEGCDRLMEFLARLNAGGLTVVMATHDVDLAIEYAGRICVLDRGRVALDGGPADVLQRTAELAAMGLRPPRCAVGAAFVGSGGEHREEGGYGGGGGVTVVGIGPGSPDYLPPVARRAVERAEVLVGGRRALAMFPGAAEKEQKEIGGDLEEALRFIREKEQAGKRVAVLVSGDPGLFSFLDYLLKRFPRERLRVIPGISSVQAAFARAKLPWHDARIVSLHGRGRDGLLEAVHRSAKVAVLTDRHFPPEALAAYLLEAGVTGKRVTVADNLSYPEERVAVGSLAEIAGLSGFSNAVVIIEDED